MIYVNWKKQKKWCANKIPVKNTKNAKKLFTFIDKFDSIRSWVELFVGDIEESYNKFFWRLSCILEYQSVKHKQDAVFICSNLFNF